MGPVFEKQTTIDVKAKSIYNKPFYVVARNEISRNSEGETM